MNRLPAGRRTIGLLEIIFFTCAFCACWACGGGNSSAGQGSTPSQHVVELSWHPSASTVVGYNIYRGTQHMGPYMPLNSSPNPQPTFTDSTVQSGGTYYYVVTAVDAASLESDYSNEVQAVVP